MSKLDPISILLPVARLVEGDLYTASDKDADGKPRLVKSGPNTGQPTQQYYGAIAVPKTPGAAHWAYETWGKLIWDLGNAEFPKIAENPSFAWKIKDGDSTVPNKKGVAPREKEGFLGHWIISLTSSYPFKITNADGSAYLLDKDVVQLGDCVEVNVNVRGNDSTQNPGVYINPDVFAFAGYSTLGRIAKKTGGPDPKSLGLGKSARSGITTTPPPSTGTAMPPTAPAGAPPAAAPPAAALPPALPGGAPAAPPPAGVAVAPAPSYLATPPGPGAAPPPPQTLPTRTMLGAYTQYTYEAMIAQGWKEADMLAQGILRVGL